MKSSITELGDIREALAKFVEGFKPNATYKKAPEVKEYLDLTIVKAVNHALASGQPYYLLGSAGIGKTSFVKWYVEEVLGYELVYIPAAQVSIENLMVPFPKDVRVDIRAAHDTDPVEGFRKVLDMLFFSKFTSDKKKVILIDEIGRADSSMGNTLMELLQEGSLAGKPIPNLIGVLAADNPAGSTYGKMSQLDFAQADRFASVNLASKDTPWRRHMAEEFPDLDLTRVFSTYDTLPVELREIINPRVLTFVIRAGLAGFPLIDALPVVNGNRVLLVRRDGKDVTRDTLDKIASALGTTNRERVPDRVKKAIAYAVSTKQNIRLIGPPGIGKTGFVKGHLAALGVKHHYDSAALLSPEDLSVPFPAGDGKSLELMPMEKFVSDEPWVWIVDELSRGSRRTQNALMEPIQERTLGGEKTGLMCTIALDNPREHGGMKLEVGKNDLAQASRFALSIEIGPEDIPSLGFLISTYGEDVATPFTEWWQDDLDDVGRALCTPRCLERMIGVWEAGNPLGWSLPVVNGEYVKVPLVELQARLDKRPMARLRQIVANIEDYLEKLEAGEEENPMVHSTVFMAFYKAEISQLEKDRESCITLYEALSKQHRINLVRQGGDRQKFWTAILLEGKKRKDARAKTKKA